MPKSARAAYRRSKASLDKNQSLASYRTPRHPERRRPAKCRDQHFVRITSDGAIGLNRADIGSAGITFVALFSVWTLRALRAGLSLRSRAPCIPRSLRSWIRFLAPCHSLRGRKQG